jgi:DNA primase
VDVVAVIGRHVELKRSGRTWKGCCPFHGERTPSFHVYPEDRHFKCYGCGEYGDVFKFLQKLQGKEFPEVVRGLAAEVGVEIPERAEESAELRRKRQERAEVLAALDAAARYFQARLWSRHGEEARGYLAGRGVTDELAKRFRVGVASREWNDLAARVAEKGVKPAALVKAGLVAERENGEGYDRFRGRLLFPIAGLDGEVIGFGGRTLPGPGAERLAKYINSPESPVYKKSRVLYGIDLAREAIRRTRQAVLVEGYFDVVGLHQAGVKNAVAVCGTALTPEHVDVLKRCDCREIVLLFDGDAAGIAGAARAAEAVLPSGVSGKVAVLPADAGKVDPDDFARAHGGAAVEQLVARAPALSEFLLDQAVRRHCGDRPAQAPMERKLGAFRELQRFLAMTPAGLARAVFEKAVATRLDVDLAAIEAELARPAEPQRRPAPRAAPGPAAPRAPAGRPGSVIRRALTPALDALALAVSFPALAGSAEDEGLLGVVEAPLDGVARGLVSGELTSEQALLRLEELLDAGAMSRVRELHGPARPAPEVAERELRCAVIEAKIEAVDREHDRLMQRIVAGGKPVPQDLQTAVLIASRRKADLEKRREALKRG